MAGRYLRQRTFQRGTNLITGNFNKPRNYKSLQTAQRRHEFLAGAPTAGTPLTLNAGDLLGVTLARFRRSFGAGSDDEPTATAGNNFQTSDVMNGSEVRDLEAYVQITNKSNADPATLTVYKHCFSFYDALIWSTLYANCPFTFDTTATNEGEVRYKTVVPALSLSPNTIYNSRFHQHYAQKVGEITLGQEGSGQETAIIRWKGIPSKAKRSQTGMYYGYSLYNASDKNEGRTLSLDYNHEIHFTEIPSNNRLPWLA